MVRVALIDPMHPDRVVRGESDLKRYDDIFVKVVKDGVKDKSAAMQLTPTAFVFAEDMANIVSAEMMRMRDEERLMKDRHYKELVELQKKYGAKA